MRSKTLQKLAEILVSTTKTTGMLFFIITSANGVGVVMLYFNADVAMGTLLHSMSTDPVVLKAMVVCLIIILGTFMKPSNSVLIMTPIILPLMTEAGVSPLHFGIIIGYGAFLGNLTPPVGMNLYVGSGINGNRFSKLRYSVIPFVLISIVMYYIVAYVPFLSTCLL